MKKPLVALAVLAGSTTVLAQSSITLFGTVDAAVQRLSTSGASLTRMGSSGLNTSKLGFRGVEDLGGGMSASFWLEGQLNSDDGTFGPTNTNNQPSGAGVAGGLTFGLRSTVSLTSRYGELRLGRATVPSALNIVVFDPFYTVGLGKNINLNLTGGIGTGSSPRTSARASNSIAYLTPGTLGGFYGHLMYALGENSSATGATRDDGRYTGLRLGYAKGPLNTSIAWGNTTYATTATAGDYIQANAGASYKFDGFTLMGMIGTEEIESSANPRSRYWSLGGAVPIGAGEIRLNYIRVNVAETANDADQISLGYTHHLSKRTAVYTTFVRVDNKATGRAFNAGIPVSAPGGKSTGWDVGIRHHF